MCLPVLPVHVPPPLENTCTCEVTSSLPFDRATYSLILKLQYTNAELRSVSSVVLRFISRRLKRQSIQWDDKLVVLATVSIPRVLLYITFKVSEIQPIVSQSHNVRSCINDDLEWFGALCL